jgi:short-subunit dehydrogenase
MDVVLVARSGERLKELAEELVERCDVSAKVVAGDLTEPDVPDAIFGELLGTPVDVLINNAGYGSQGAFSESDRDWQLNMVRLNILALTHLTHLFLPDMLQRGSGRILNIASTAAFQPGPLMAVYYASKAYVLSFSEALAEEVRGSGITVSALCPGPTATEFQARAHVESSRLRRVGMMDASRVAKEGFRGMKKGKAVIVNGWKNRFLVQSIRFSPRFAVRRVVKWLNGID